jgi:hypothetical protein
MVVVQAGVLRRRLRRLVHGVRARLRDGAIERRRQSIPVVGVDVRVVPPPRQGDVGQSLIHEALAAVLAVAVQQHAIRAETLAAVARHGIAVTGAERPAAPALRDRR